MPSLLKTITLSSSSIIITIIFMKVSLLVGVLSILVILAGCDPIQVTLYASPEADEGSDYVEIVLKVGERDQSLPQALASSAKRALQIRDAVLKYCGEPEKKKCQESVEVGNAVIESKYQVVRKE